jgi:hypothetical protein
MIPNHRRLKDMPTKEAFVTMVANQMMKGPNYGKLPGTPRQRELFRLRHAPQIRWVIRELPRCSAAVGAVLTKCLIMYGEEKVSAFCKVLKNCNFEGQYDPAHLLWKFLQRHSGKDTVSAYQRTVCAAKAYMEGKTLKKLRPLVNDIFDWDEGWTVPDALIPGWNPDKLPGLSEEEVEREVDEALAEMKK